MVKLLASDVNQGGKRPVVALCGVVSEVRFWDAQFIGGEKKPRVTVPLRSCNNTGKYDFYNQSAVSTTAPTSHDPAKFGSLQSPALIVERDFIDDLPICIGKFRRIKGLRADDGSPVFGRFWE